MGGGLSGTGREEGGQDQDTHLPVQIRRAMPAL